MKILVSGSTGFLGSTLVPFLIEQGHSVVRLVRNKTTSSGPQVRWDPNAGTIDDSGIEGVDAVVHLAGENITAKRWSAKQKTRLLDSRVKGTRLLSETLAQSSSPPKVLASASAYGYYGDRGGEVLTEESGPGSDFLAELTQEWEAASEPAAKAGIRVINLRSGLVFGPNGGALAKMLPAFKMGVGGKLGNGKQYVSWISLEDWVRAVLFALNTDTLKGPINVATPNPVTNVEFTKTVGRVLSRPTFFTVPAFALRIVFGEVADTLLASGRVEPTKLLASEFEFHHPDLESALRASLGKS